MWKGRIVFYVKRKNSDLNLWIIFNYCIFFIDKVKDKVILFGKMLLGKKNWFRINYLNFKL